MSNFELILNEKRTSKVAPKRYDRSGRFHWAKTATFAKASSYFEIREPRYYNFTFSRDVTFIRMSEMMQFYCLGSLIRFSIRWRLLLNRQPSYEPPGFGKAQKKSLKKKRRRMPDSRISLYIPSANSRSLCRPIARPKNCEISAISFLQNPTPNLRSAAHDFP